MKPVAIFRHSNTEGPGHFATFLEANGIAWQLFASDANTAIPTDSTAYAGLAFMGGPMSVNDPLPWIDPSLALIRHAVEHEVPVIGHCLGGQLMSKALGGVVSRNPVKEIGWGEVTIDPSPVANHWFEGCMSFESFHWHGETFTIPSGATRLGSSAWCDNQLFALGPHLGMQCHVEMTEQMIRVWARSGWNEIRDNPVPSVQSGESMQTNLEARVGALHAIADRLYGKWIGGLKR
ncbi:MAG: type 1 glutamine amidotransferase [Proteobacteria bacterium]|nr:type 1 glutamine amidotransferase [Burkholderiales bacterium]